MKNANLYNVAGTTALITGGSRGIGQAIAELFARQGAEVIICSRKQAGVDEVATAIRAAGGKAHAFAAHVGKLEEIQSLLQRMEERGLNPDILVNNAGIVRDSAIWNMDEADFDSVIAVHLKGAWAPSKHAAVHWRERNKANGAPVGGRIINTTSGAGLVGNFGQTNYATAKAGIAGMTQTLSLELAKMGVTVNCVGPAAATRITATMPGAPAVVEPDEVPDDEWNRMDPAVSSPLVAWLASDESQHVTGQVIRAVAENIILMKGWADGPTINNKGKRWDADKLGTQLNTDVFFTRAPGLRY